MNDICEEELLALMKKISIRLEIQLEQNLREDDVSGVQVYLLVHILRRHRNGTYISELCREEGVSKTTMSLLIKKLREKEYLVFQENEKMIGRNASFRQRNCLRQHLFFLNGQSGWNVRSVKH